MAQYRDVVVDKAYEIVLGFNDGTLDIIRDKPLDGSIVAQNKEVVLLCDQSQWLWISWDDGIRFGRGPEVGADVKMVWKDILYPHTIENIGIHAYDGDAVWEFVDVQGSVHSRYIIYRHNTTNY